MDKNATLQALSQALKLEQEGQEFYLKAAEESLDEKAEALFRSLADDERMHAEMIQRQLHAIEGEGKYVLLPDLDVPAIDLEARLFPPERAQVEARIGRNPTDLDALHVALENEIKSYDLYRQAAAATESEAGRAMYRWLAKAELTHFELLMSNYEAMVALGGWV
ncbi:MAG: ferritin family protein [Chloroflexi bacterium]|jgi:rubrerythrin|nr:ferritin family protein [Chloroflexota bacterium]